MEITNPHSHIYFVNLNISVYLLVIRASVVFPCKSISPSPASSWPEQVGPGLKLRSCSKIEKDETGRFHPFTKTN